MRNTDTMWTVDARLMMIISGTFLPSTGIHLRVMYSSRTLKLAINITNVPIMTMTAKSVPCVGSGSCPLSRWILMSSPGILSLRYDVLAKTEPAPDLRRARCNVV